jgi:hypothetical protein
MTKGPFPLVLDLEKSGGEADPDLHRDDEIVVGTVGIPRRGYGRNSSVVFEHEVALELWPLQQPLLVVASVHNTFDLQHTTSASSTRAIGGK